MKLIFCFFVFFSVCKTSVTYISGLFHPLHFLVHLCVGFVLARYQHL